MSAQPARSTQGTHGDELLPEWWVLVVPQAFAPTGTGTTAMIATFGQPGLPILSAPVPEVYVDQKELECFLVLADELHFGRTAARLHLSRARVSQLIQKLERRVGAPLFTRTSRRVALTSLGGRLRDDLTPHYRGIENALARAVTSARGIEQVLHVGFSTPLAGEMVMKTIEKLRATHPELAVEVCEVPLSDPYGMLRKGEFDLQLVDFPMREDDLTRGPTLLVEGRVLAVAVGHPLAGQDTLTLEDLARVPLLTIAGDLPEYWLEHQLPTRTPSGRPIQQGPPVTNFQEALTLVAGGKGALLSGAHIALYHGRPGISYIPVEGDSPLGYGLMWRSGDGNRTIELFGRTAHEIAGDMAPATASADFEQAIPAA
ncbi:LysR family transcriptional regulator [Streptomyces sp. H39-S7]|uniref:LysR family transcriptional regulator n=1 Tax=Streptomyces sp. H39-S7 TaxID=3004357 RepID=UPI0022AE5BA1|nr:LysR family transcriptional regulator [Streptomyces sp. H39-S7]MCZ4124658.1 LysR family transcriptional regulator [Streptomyces sp. H39-S7]